MKKLNKIEKKLIKLIFQIYCKDEEEAMKYIDIEKQYKRNIKVMQKIISKLEI